MEGGGTKAGVATALPPPLQICSEPAVPGEHSGRSETFSEALQLTDPAAAAAQPVGSPQQDHALTADEQLEPEESPLAPPGMAVAAAPDIAPLPPPDASEGPEAAAEYEVYLQRWDAGDTLVQRWHRLAQSGRLCEVRADWDDWQLDIMLTQVKERTQAALKEAGRPQPNYFGGVVTGTRLRRGRGEVHEADDSPDEGGPSRRVRSRRAPSSLQDYHVDANKTPDRTPDAFPDYRQHPQLMPSAAAPGAADAASEDSTDDAADNVTARALQHQHQQQHHAAAHQQQQPAAGRGRGRRGPLPQQPPKRVVTKVQRNALAASQPGDPAAGRQLNRVITPYNPQLQQQQQAAMQQQQMLAAAMQQQQEQQQVVAAAAMAGVSPEMLEEFYKMGSRLGAAFGQQGEGAGGDAGTLANGLASNPAAMAAFMHVCCQYGVNPAVLTQQASAVMGPHQ